METLELTNDWPVQMHFNKMPMSKAIKLDFLPDIVRFSIKNSIQDCKQQNFPQSVSEICSEKQLRTSGILIEITA